MSNQTNNVLEKLTGRAKQKAGDLLDNERLRREGRAQENKADARASAENLEKLAKEKRKEAQGHMGQQIASQQ